MAHGRPTGSKVSIDCVGLMRSAALCRGSLELPHTGSRITKAYKTI